MEQMLILAVLSIPAIFAIIMLFVISKQEANEDKELCSQKSCRATKPVVAKVKKHSSYSSNISRETSINNDDNYTNPLVLGTILGGALDDIDNRHQPEPVHIHVEPLQSIPVETYQAPAEAYQPAADHGYNHASHDSGYSSSYDGGSSSYDSGSSFDCGGCDGGGCGGD